MSKDELRRKIAALTEQIAALPKGYISQKTISGKVYSYLQWSENGQKKSRYLRKEELESVAAEIERRKTLQAERKALQAELSSADDLAGERAGQIPCVLMHKRMPVAELTLDAASGFIQRVGAVFAPEHIPVGVAMRRGIPDRASLNDWWTERSIPASRSGIREALETMELTNTKQLLIRCFGLSLSDQYWICPEGSLLSWDNINFFQNAFSDDIGDVLFGAGKKSNALDFSSPDNTSDGNLKKRWKIIDGKRYLVKGGSNPFRQQPFNEVIAAEIMERLGIPHVPYSVTWSGGFPYSVCEDFVTADTELIPAWRIMQTQKKANNRSTWQHFVRCAEAMGIPGVVPFLDRMIALDYIIANEDRHLNNFGALRNAETLEWIGMAPIYDSGSSLGYDKVAPEIRSGRGITCKPFKKRHEDQLRLVTDFSWIDFDRLTDVRERITETLSAGEAKEYMDAGRISAIADTVWQRIERVRALSQQAAAPHDAVDDDVTENVAETYGGR